MRDDPYYYTNHKHPKKQRGLSSTDKVKALLIKSQKDDEVLFNK